MKWTYLIFFFLSSFNFVSELAFSQNKTHKGHKHSEGFKGEGFGGHSDMDSDAMFVKRLKLDEKQIKQYRKLKKDERKKSKEFRVKIDAVHLEVSKLMKSGANKSILIKKFKEVQLISNKLGLLHFSSGLDLKEILRPDQKKIIDGMFQGPSPMRRGKPKRGNMPKRKK